MGNWGKTKWQKIDGKNGMGKGGKTVGKTKNGIGTETEANRRDGAQIGRIGRVGRAK